VGKTEKGVVDSTECSDDCVRFIRSHASRWFNWLLLEAAMRDTAEE